MKLSNKMKSVILSLVSGAAVIVTSASASAQERCGAGVNCPPGFIRPGGPGHDDNRGGGQPPRYDDGRGGRDDRGRDRDRDHGGGYVPPRHDDRDRWGHDDDRYRPRPRPGYPPSYPPPYYPPRPTPPPPPYYPPSNPGYQVVERFVNVQLGYGSRVDLISLLGISYLEGRRIQSIEIEGRSLDYRSAFVQIETNGYSRGSVLLDNYQRTQSLYLSNEYISRYSGLTLSTDGSVIITRVKIIVSNY